MPSDLDFAGGDKAHGDRSVGEGPKDPFCCAGSSVGPSTDSTPIGHAARSVVAVNV